jgi:formyltetrahydrofolate deformylase
MTSSYTVSIDCQDQKGIVHRVTGVLFEAGLNVEEQGEFVDHLTNQFFMRTEVSGRIDHSRMAQALKEAAPPDATIRITPKGRKRVVVMVSKEPHCLGDLLIRHAYNDLRAEIAAVISNHLSLQELADRFGVPWHYVSHEGRSREEHEQELSPLLERYQPDYIVLAKYMRVLSGALVARYRERIINIHHSFLPAFAGSRPYHQAYARGVKIIGATAHFVTDSLDQGPIIAQDVIAIDHSKSPGQLIHAGRDVEKSVLAKALRLVFEDRVFVHQNRTIVFD